MKKADAFGAQRSRRPELCILLHSKFITTFNISFNSCRGKPPALPENLQSLTGSGPLASFQPQRGDPRVARGERKRTPGMNRQEQSPARGEGRQREGPSPLAGLHLSDLAFQGFAVAHAWLFSYRPVRGSAESSRDAPKIYDLWPNTRWNGGSLARSADRFERFTNQASGFAGGF